MPSQEMITCHRFFQRGKTTCSKVLESKSKFQKALAQLGSGWDLPPSTAKDLEIFFVQYMATKQKRSILPTTRCLTESTPKRTISSIWPH